MMQGHQFRGHNQTNRERDNTVRTKQTGGAKWKKQLFEGITPREKTDGKKYLSNKFRSTEADTSCRGVINRLPVCSTILTDGAKWGILVKRLKK